MQLDCLGVEATRTKRTGQYAWSYAWPEITAARRLSVRRNGNAAWTAFDTFKVHRLVKQNHLDLFCEESPAGSSQ